MPIVVALGQTVCAYAEDPKNFGMLGPSLWVGGVADRIEIRPSCVTLQSRETRVIFFRRISVIILVPFDLELWYTTFDKVTHDGRISMRSATPPTQRDGPSIPKFLGSSAYAHTV